MKTVLVVGPSVPASFAKDKEITVIHKPCICLSPIDVDQNLIKQKIACSNGILFTSKHAVQELSRIGSERLYNLFQGTIVSIGEETSKVASSHFPAFPCITAAQPTQEGVVACLVEYKKEHKLHTLFWPRSSHARPFLKQALTATQIALIDIPFYTPKLIPQSYCFEGIDEILFTCPSSVKAFFSLVEKKDVAHLTLTPIGPITQKTLSSLLYV